MKRIMYLTFVALLGLSINSCTPDDGEIGPQGPKGEQGLPGSTGQNGKDGKDGQDGEDGNANVQKFYFEIDSADWNAGHYGAGNNHHYYEVSSSLTGGINMSNSNYAVIGYARTIGQYDEKKPIPSVFSTRNNYGIKIDMSISRYEILLSKTLNGHDNNVLDASDIPKKTQIELVFIKIGALSSIEDKVDINNYEALMDYLTLNELL